MAFLGCIGNIGEISLMYWEGFSGIDSMCQYAKSPLNAPDLL